MKKTLAVFIVVSMILSGCSTSTQEETTKNTSIQTQETVNNESTSDSISQNEISPKNLLKKIQSEEKIVLLDVREKEEYEDVHIQGTTNRISIKELSEEAFQKNRISKNSEIIVYCRSGKRSHAAATQMKEMGYTNVLELDKGILHWIENGLPVENGAENFLLAQETSN